MTAWRVGGAGLALLATLGVLLAGCGGGIILQDDLAVQRTGTGPGANLSVVVNDGGTATCNGHGSVAISDPQLIESRYINTTIAPEAKKKQVLAPGPRAEFRYVVRTPDGRVTFSDDSRHQPPILEQLQLLVLQISQQDCHLSQ